MRIVHISTYDLKGGAARSAWRLHRGLVDLGVHSTMLVKNKASADESVFVAEEDASGSAKRLQKNWKRIQREWVDLNRTALSNTHFSVAAPAWNVSRHPAVLAADIIHLHWSWWLVAHAGLRSLVELNKPIVWTFHDQRAFTGGCHFSAGCDGYRRGCEQCPQLQQDPFAITSAALSDARDCLPHGAILPVCPSRWLARCARESTVFRGQSVEVIPYGIDTQLFSPQDKAAAREKLGLPTDAVCFLYGADNTAEKRKGFAGLVNAVKVACRDESFRHAIDSGRVRFLSFGAPRRAKETEFPIPVTSLGRVDETQLPEIYSAADVFLLPSLEDNLPNVLLESMSCGTPVIAHDVGGIPDLVRDGVSGMLVSSENAAGFGAAILRCADDRAWRLGLAEQCRKVRTSHTLEAQARAYHALYLRLPAQAMAITNDQSQTMCPPAAPASRMASLYPKLLAGAKSRARKRFLATLFSRRPAEPTNEST